MGAPMRVTGIPAPPEFLLSQTGPVDDGFEPDNENGRIAWRCLARRMVFWQAPPVPQESPPQSGPPPPSEPPPVVPVACRGHVSPSVPHLVHSAPTEAPDVQGDAATRHAASHIEAWIFAGCRDRGIRVVGSVWWWPQLGPRSRAGHQCSGAVAVSGRYVGVWRSHPLHWVLWQVVGALGGCASLVKEPSKKALVQ